MRAITFYSYKGGVGRTLTLANIAHYLTRLGQRVVAIDLDLEAPGLHYKLRPRGNVPCPGVVDLITSFLEHHEMPSIADALCMVKGESAREPGSIAIITAGSLREGYWQRLADIPWHQFLVGPRGDEPREPDADRRGIGFFLELKARIEAATGADYLLIDARTGITELGGLAAGLLADDLVCFLAHNEESLDGTAAVIRSVLTTPKLQRKGQPAPAVRIFPVLVRLPEAPELAEDTERAIVDKVSRHLKCDLDGPVEPLMVAHSQPHLQIDEEILLAESEEGASDTVLFADYVRFFNRLLPPELVEKDVQRQTEEAWRRAQDDPDDAERLLTKVANRFPHPVSYRALLKFYRLRSRFDEEALDWARKLVDLTLDPAEPLIWDLVRRCLDQVELSDNARADRVRFVERVWESHGGTDWKMALELAAAYLVVDAVRAYEILQLIAVKLDPTATDGAAEVMRALVAQGLHTDALALFERVHSGRASAELLRLAAAATLQVASTAMAIVLLDSEGIDAALRDEPALRARLNRLAGRNDQFLARLRAETAELVELIRREGVDRRRDAQLRQVLSSFLALDRRDEFWQHFQFLKPPDVARLRSLERQLLHRLDDDPERWAELGGTRSE